MRNGRIAVFKLCNFMMMVFASFCCGNQYDRHLLLKYSTRGSHADLIKLANVGGELYTTNFENTTDASVRAQPFRNNSLYSWWKTTPPYAIVMTLTNDHTNDASSALWKGTFNSENSDESIETWMTTDRMTITTNRDYLKIEDYVFSGKDLNFDITYITDGNSNNLLMYSYTITTPILLYANDPSAPTDMNMVTQDLMRTVYFMVTSLSQTVPSRENVLQLKGYITVLQFGVNLQTPSSTVSGAIEVIFKYTDTRGRVFEETMTLTEISTTIVFSEERYRDIVKLDVRANTSEPAYDIGIGVNYYDLSYNVLPVEFIYIEGLYRTGSTQCLCSCNTANTVQKWENKTFVRIFEEQTAQEVKEIIKKITVNKTSLSSTVRKKTSASDHRTSAKGIGIIGGAVIGTLALGIVALDVAPILYALATGQKISTKKKK